MERLAIAVILFISLGGVTAAWAQTPPEPQDQSEVTGNAEQIGVLEVETPSTAEDQTERLQRSAEQINQQLSGQREPGEIELPDGMVIRGSSRGGVAIGTEL